MAWATAFRDTVNSALEAGDTATLLAAAEGRNPDAELAVNSGEHFLPLLYAAGARLPGDEVAVFNDTLDGALSMTSVGFGEIELALA